MATLWDIVWLVSILARLSPWRSAPWCNVNNAIKHDLATFLELPTENNSFLYQNAPFLWGLIENSLALCVWADLSAVSHIAFMLGFHIIVIL